MSALSLLVIYQMLNACTLNDKLNNPLKHLLYIDVTKPYIDGVTMRLNRKSLNQPSRNTIPHGHPNWRFFKSLFLTSSASYQNGIYRRTTRSCERLVYRYCCIGFNRVPSNTMHLVHGDGGYVLIPTWHW
jgi:hypothetical protein